MTRLVPTLAIALVLALPSSTRAGKDEEPARPRSGPATAEEESPSKLEVPRGAPELPGSLREGRGLRPSGIRGVRATKSEGEEGRPAAREGGASRTDIEACKESPRPTGDHNFAAGESLVYDVDIMGVRAGSLTLGVETSSGAGPSFTATTRTNTFFANVREVEGRATSFTSDTSLRPVRFREDSTEDGVRKWSEVLFHQGRNEVDVRFGIGKRERRVRYPATVTPMDLLSLVYYLRTLKLEVGDEICMDVYANRRLWRVTGEVASEEFIRTPAGGFETLLLSGSARRMDLPTMERELHVWFSKDEARTPVAAMSVIDLGPVRARLSRTTGESAGQPRRPSGGGRW